MSLLKRIEQGQAQSSAIQQDEVDGSGAQRLSERVRREAPTGLSDRSKYHDLKTLVQNKLLAEIG